MPCYQQRSGASGLSHARALDAADVGATAVAVDTSRALLLKLYRFCTLVNLGALLRCSAASPASCRDLLLFVVALEKRKVK